MNNASHNKPINSNAIQPVAHSIATPTTIASMNSNTSNSKVRRKATTRCNYNSNNINNSNNHNINSLNHHNFNNNSHYNCYELNSKLNNNLIYSFSNNDSTTSTTPNKHRATLKAR